MASGDRNRNTIGGAGVRGGEVANYSHKTSACEGQELGGGGGGGGKTTPNPPLFPPLWA